MSDTPRQSRYFCIVNTITKEPKCIIDFAQVSMMWFGEGGKLQILQIGCEQPIAMEGLTQETITAYRQWASQQEEA